MPLPTYSVDDLLKEFTKQHEELEALHAALRHLTEKSSSYLDIFANYYYGLWWWQKLFAFLIYIASTALAVTALLLPHLLMIPVVLFYLVAVFFLSDHYYAHLEVNEALLKRLNDLLQHSIEALTSSREALHQVLLSTAHVNQALEAQVETFSKQNTRLEAAQTTVDTQKNVLRPVTTHLETVARHTQQKSEKILDVLHQTHEALVVEKEKLIDETLPALSRSIEGIQASGNTLSEMEKKFTLQLDEMKTLTSKLSEVLQTLLFQLQEKETAAFDVSVQSSDTLLKHAEKLSDASDALAKVAEEDLGLDFSLNTPPRSRSPSLKLFDNTEAIKEASVTNELVFSE